MTYDVLVYGPLFCDLIFTELPEMPELGTEIFAGNFTMTVGGSAIVAAGLQKLGAKVGLVADIGNDALSRVVGQLLDDLHIDRTFVREHPHPLTQLTVALSFPQDRAFITRFEKPDIPADLAAILREHPTRHVHIGSFLGAFDVPDACQIAHDAGATISLDPGWDETALRDPRLHNMLTDLDFFLPSRSELCYMLDEPDANKALERATNRMTHGTVIMKNGADGASAKSKTLETQVPTLTVTPIDTTGAGDAFDAGFLYALTHDYALQDCMRFGAICGALTTTRIGGATGTPTLEEVKKWL
ncbi:MAG: carbohydrate kinase family protein [Aggregatilineales bacterium]